MLLVRPPRKLWISVLGLAILLLASSALLICRHPAVAVHDCPDCDDVYQSILRRYRKDDQWMKTHALLNTTDGSRFIASSLVQMRSRLPWFERLRYGSAVESFLAQTDGEPLPYSGASEKGLRLILASKRGEMLERGITVFTFTLPGFSFDHRRAVVFPRSGETVLSRIEVDPIVWTKNRSSLDREAG
jgi:hypothetical protein